MHGHHSERFKEALAWAYDLHARQERKGSSTPYISHLLGVCDLVLQHGGTEDEAIAALLHDSIEDQGRTRADIESRFGAAVADIVEGCTDAWEHPKPPWRERKEQYLAHVREAPAAIRRVAACDKLHNARSLLSDFRVEGPSLWERFRGKRDGQIWYFRTFIANCRRAAPSDGAIDAQLRRILDELERVVDDLERITAD